MLLFAKTTIKCKQKICNSYGGFGEDRPRNELIRSIGSGKIIVEFFSADIEFNVC